MKTPFSLAPISGMALALGLLIGSVSALADELSEKDRDFLQNAVQIGHYELEGSKLAITKSTNPVVVRFARRTVQDYSKLSIELDKLAKTKALDVSGELNPVQQENLQVLAGKEGAEFDAQYASAIAEEAHANQVEYFTDAAEEADDVEIRNFAKKNQPALKQHLFGARILNTRMNTLLSPQ